MDDLTFIIFATVICTTFVGGIFLTSYIMGPPDSKINKK